MRREMDVTRTLRAAVGLTMSALLPGTAVAQVVSSLDDVVRAGRWTRGDAVYVTVVGGQRVKAEIADASSAGLWLRDGRKKRRLAEAELLKVERRDSLHGGIWIGIGIGVLATPLTCNFGRYCVFSGLLGGLVGGIVDAGVREVLYEAQGREARRVKVSPILAKGGVGAGMWVGW